MYSKSFGDISLKSFMWTCLWKKGYRGLVATCIWVNICGDIHMYGDMFLGTFVRSCLYEHAYGDMWEKDCRSLQSFSHMYQKHVSGNLGTRF